MRIYIFGICSFLRAFFARTHTYLFACFLKRFRLTFAMVILKVDLAVPPERLHAVVYSLGSFPRDIIKEERDYETPNVEKRIG